VTQPDRPAGRGRALQPPPVKQRALDLQIDAPILQPETLRDPLVVEQLRALQPDVGVVAAYGEILRRAVISIPPAGYLNIHPSLLPRWRGPTPVSGAILAGDTETGVTIMRLAAKMDAGPIVDQYRCPLAPDARAGKLLTDLFTIGSERLLRVLPSYVAGEVMPRAQDEALATYTQMVRKEDGLVDWARPAAQIERMVRAYDPWPGVQTTWRGQPLRIVDAAVGEGEGSIAPGALAERPEGLVVGCGDGLLLLRQVQPAGKRAMAAAEWRRGLRDLQAEQLGR
jgi:methionyl-tRNA formyltransferase